VTGAVAPPLVRWAGAIGIVAAACGLAGLSAPGMPIDPTAGPAAAIAAYAIAFACVGAAVLAVAGTAPDLGRGAIPIVLAAAAGLALVAGRPPGLGLAIAVLVVLLAGGTAAGAAIGARIEHAGHLLPVAIVSSLADLVSVLSPGAPSDVVADTPALVSVLAISWPMPGTHDVAPILGVGDVIVVALYVAAARRHALSIGRTIVALAIGLAATAVVVAWTALPIPALPFLGAAVVLAHPAARALPVADRRPAAWGLAVIVVALVALALASR
jgi:hypothetical protein